MRYALYCLAMALSASLLSGCSPLQKTVKQEVVSPDGGVRAILVDVDGGATTTISREVYLKSSSPVSFGSTCKRSHSNRMPTPDFRST